MRYYTSRIQTHKTRPRCGSIIVTIDTHKNSKIQRLSEFFLMRIGACFATFAILSYTKIIDNSWYLRHLFSYFLLGIQWTVFHQADLNYTFPISFSEAAYGAHVTHIGTDNDTAAIVRALDQNHVEIGIGKQSGHDAYVIIYGK